MALTQAQALRDGYIADITTAEAKPTDGSRTEEYLRLMVRLLADILYRHEIVRPEDAPQS